MMRETLTRFDLFRVASGRSVPALLAAPALLTLCALAPVATRAASPASPASVSVSSARLAGGELEEVIVTARKRSENIRDIPASISAVSESTIREAHITQLDDLGSLVSELNIF